MRIVASNNDETVGAEVKHKKSLVLASIYQFRRCFFQSKLLGGKLLCHRQGQVLIDRLGLQDYCAKKQHECEQY